MAAVDWDILRAQLERWAGAHYHESDGHEGVGIRDVHPMPGHAGLSFGFSVTDARGDVDRLVVRMPPKGVRRSGNTDVLRQVPLLQALLANGVRVAPVVWWDADEQWFEVPYFMVRYLRGTTYAVRDPAPQLASVPPADIFRAAVEALASAHRVDHTVHLADWEHPKSLQTEIEFWAPILQKAAEPAWIEMGERARQVLLENVPADPHVGVFHGDFQTGNVLFDGAEVVALVDWEISGIGAQLIDLGWLLFMNDAESWFDSTGLERVPPFEDIVGWYSAAVGRAVTLDDVAFYRALSGYRFGVISGLNVMLHRTGKRRDLEWERIALSVPAMFRRACQLLGA
jgi:aminoglycoside phosphotransferase (APT) family kinase protein